MLVRDQLITSQGSTFCVSSSFISVVHLVVLTVLVSRLGFGLLLMVRVRVTIWAWICVRLTVRVTVRLTLQ